MHTAEVTTLVTKVKRKFSELNFEMHVLQSGLHAFTLRNRWTGLPVAFTVLVIVWAVYWVTVPILLVLLLLAYCIRPLETRK